MAIGILSSSQLKSVCKNLELFEKNIERAFTAPFSNIYKLFLNALFLNFLGDYYIDVFYGNQLVNGSPFKINVCDPNRIKVTPALFGLVNQVVKFEGL